MGRVPVPGLLAGRPAGQHQRRVGRDDFGEPAVHLARLAGQQLVVDRLADQGVPEDVAVGLGPQHVGRHRRAQRPAERGAVEAGDRGQQPVTDLVAARAGDPDHLLGLFRQPPQPGHQQVVQGLRQPRAGLAVPHQRLGEQRVALGPFVHRRQQLVGRLAADDLGHQPAGVLAAEPAEVHPGDPFDPVELGQQRPQRMRAVQVVGPVGGHDQHAVQRPLIADQEGQQVPGGLVGPVHVLDDQDHRAGFGQVLQHLEHLLEQPGARLAGFVGTGRGAELGEQPGQFPAAAAGQQGGHPGRPEVAHELAEHGGEGSERQALGAEFQAAAGQHPRPRAAGTLGELPDQTGLPHPGLAADQHGRRPAPGRLGQRGLQRGQLQGTTDQGRAR